MNPFEVENQLLFSKIKTEKPLDVPEFFGHRIDIDPLKHTEFSLATIVQTIDASFIVQFEALINAFNKQLKETVNVPLNLAGGQSGPINTASVAVQSTQPSPPVVAAQPMPPAPVAVSPTVVSSGAGVSPTSATASAVPNNVPAEPVQATAALPADAVASIPVSPSTSPAPVASTQGVGQVNSLDVTPSSNLNGLAYFTTIEPTSVS